MGNGISTCHGCRRLPRRLRRPGAVWAALALLLILVGFAGAGYAAAGGRPQTAAAGSLAGRVTRAPMSPVRGPGITPVEEPAPRVKLVITTPEGQEIVSVMTDAQGQYRVNLRPGSYLLKLAPGQGRDFSKQLPAGVMVNPDLETHLDIHLDSGIR